MSARVCREEARATHEWVVCLVNSTIAVVMATCLSIIIEIAGADRKICKKHVQ
jgi:hypothetical protein